MKNTIAALAVMAIALLPVGQVSGKNDATRQDRADGSKSPRNSRKQNAMWDIRFNSGTSALLVVSLPRFSPFLQIATTRRREIKRTFTIVARAVLRASTAASNCGARDEKAATIYGATCVRGACPSA
jgi:hypothetical protein